MSKVIIQECKDYSIDNLIFKLNDGIEKLGGWRKFVHPGDKVLLKINLIGPKASESAAVTHSEFVRALVRILKSLNWQGNIKDIIIDGDYRTIPKLENYKLPKKFRSTKKRNSTAVIKVIDFFKTRPVVNIKKCKSCDMCVESCPVAAINKETKKIDYKECIECMCCHELCIHKAVDLKKDNALAGVIASMSGKKYR